jgi:hypothetical protein
MLQSSSPVKVAAMAELIGCNSVNQVAGGGSLPVAAEVDHVVAHTGDGRNR